MSEVITIQPETEFARLQREAGEYRTQAAQNGRSMDALNIASGSVMCIGAALTSLAISMTPNLAEHSTPQTPIEWVEVGAEAALLAAEAAILAETMQLNRKSNQLEAQASQALMQAAEIPPYQR